MDGLLAQVFGNFGPGVVGPKLLLVDVLFKDVAQHIGVNFVIAPARCVIQAPGVAVKQAVQLLKGHIGDGNVCAVLRLDGVGQKQPAVQVFHLAQQLLGGGVAFFLRGGKALKKEGLQKAGVILVGGGAAAGLQFVAQVLAVAPVNKALKLQKPDEHHPVQNDRGVPAPLPFIGDAANVAQKLGVGQLKLVKEFFGDPLNIQRGFHPAGYGHYRQVAVGVQFAYIHKHGADFTQKKVAGLAAHKIVRAGKTLAALALDPIPDTLAARGIHKNQQVLVILAGDGLLYGGAGFGIGHVAGGGGQLKDHHPGQLGHLAAGVALAVNGDGVHSGLGRLLPA